MKKIILSIMLLAILTMLVSCSDLFKSGLNDIEDIFDNDNNETCNHYFSDWESETNDCTKPYIAKRTCKICGFTEEDMFVNQTHDITVIEGKLPTCTKAGYSEKEYCKMCGYIVKESVELEKIPHEFENNVCVNCGLKSQKVFVDGIESNFIPDIDDYVAFVRSEDDKVSLSYDYDKKTVADQKDAEKYVIYLYKVDKLFETLDEMVKSTTNFKAGSYIGIKSYFSGVNRGASLYQVSNTPGAYYKKLSSGKYANLIPFTVEGGKIVTVDQFGAKGDGKTADHTAIMNALNFKDANEIRFESDIYLQTSAIKVSGLSGKSINGQGAKLINKYNSLVNDDVTFESCTSMRLINLEICCTEEKGKGTLYKNNDHIQFRIKTSNHFIVDNVKITAPDNSTEDRHIGSVWVTNSDNVTIKNSRIVNLSHSLSNSAGVWVSANGGTSSGFIFYNNYLEKNTHDEVLAFFMGTITDVTVRNNEIYTHDEPISSPSSHAIGFGVNAIETTLKNIEFFNNKVDVVSQKDAVHFGNVENLSIHDNEITLRNLSDSQIVQNGLFRVSEPAKNEQKNVNIFKNTLKIVSTANKTSGYNIGDLFCNLRSGINIYQNEITVNGTVNKIVNGDTGASIKNNVFNFDFPPLTNASVDDSNTINW